ncbi:MAG TPA: hypothetical protein VM425_21615 [Myxococcota bacterium]|nr:hypothetical protein [Myxococcota bacterium]
MTGRSFRRAMAVMVCLVGLLSTSVVQARGGPPVKIRGNYAIIDEVYFAVLELPKGSKADGSTARLVERQILDFLRRSGYLLATVKAGVVKNHIEVLVDEGRLEKVVFLGMGTLRTLQMKIGLSLPHHIFNKPYLVRQLRSLSARYNVKQVTYQLVPCKKVRHAGPQIGVDALWGHEVIPPSGSYELHVQLGRKGWGAGLDLGLDFDFPDGLALGAAYLGEGAMFRNDRWMVGGSLGAKLRNHLDSGDPFISLSRAVAEARWYTPALIGRLRPYIWLRAELGSRQRADLDIDLYYSARTEASLDLAYEFREGLVISAGGGASERFIFGVDQLATAGTPEESSARFEPFVVGRMEFVFDPGNLRRDRWHRLILDTRYYWSERENGFGRGSLQYVKVFDLGWHDLWVKSRGAFLWGHYLFDDEEPIGGKYLRGVFGDKWFTSKAANLVLEFRLSLARDLFKLSLFHDLAVFPEIDRQTGGETWRVADSFGLGFHALVLDVIQFDIYYSVGFASDGDFDHGFSASLKKVF